MSASSLIKVTLPDGSVREIESGQSVLDLATTIGPGLAKATLGAKLDGDAEIHDLRTPLTADCAIEIVTTKGEGGLDVIRHSASHIMADAILQLFPEAKLSIGPSTSEGFYYDIDLEHRLTDEDLEAIEKLMKTIVSADTPFVRCDVGREESLERFRKDGEIYKVELIEGFDEDAPISLYRHGDGRFEDLCRGPHVPSTGYVKAWKVLKVAGAYWRGDENRQMLQRIYGTAFNDKKELKAYLERLEEAKKRDHRKLGKELDLFVFSPSAPASPFFMPKGARVYNELQNYVREKYVTYGYDEVITPQVLDVELWKRSGHWDKYKENMFFTSFDKAEYGVKPMNCPCHALMFGMQLPSYRDLPIRYADFGRLHRYERAGATSGLTRVRTFAQDDAHIFCAEDQIGSEIASVIRMVKEIYEDFAFTDIGVYLSTRPEKSVGSDEIWERAEADLRSALADNDVDYTVNPGDGAFYGPKIDFVVKDAIGREWQLGTVQLDFNMPQRFDLEFIDSDGKKACPVMIHRAILGSLERFMAIVIEHFAGKFPLWLAPVQVRVATINDDCNAFGEEVRATLAAQGYRVDADLENAKIGAKIRRAQLEQVPYVCVVGKKEVENREVAVRERGGVDHGTLGLEAFSAMMNERLKARS